MTNGSATSDKPGTLESLSLALTSWRTASVSLFSFASGIPLGLVWTAIPDWMRDTGVDIRVVGLFTLVQAPWTFKFLWSPFMDRYVPPFWGRRRGWIAIIQLALAMLLLGLAGLGGHPETPWVVGALALAIAFAAASHDIVIDAYTVEVLHKHEQAIAVGARTALYRGGMLVAGGLSIWLAAKTSWALVNVALALLYLPMLFITWKAPEPEERQQAPRTIREAVWLPFLGALSRHRALEILAFVMLYKLTDALSQSLLRPFLNDMGYDAFDRGFVLGFGGLLITIAGTFLGGVACAAIGMGHSLWIFGFLQIFSNIGYVLITYDPGNQPLMYAAMSFEVFTTGLGMGAFGVFLLRLTQKRFSATQYALFSSLFGLPRILAGPVTGFVVDALGWRTFFWITMAAGIPGLVLLQRFAPLGLKELTFRTEPPRDRRTLSQAQLVLRGVLGGTVGFALATGLWALLSAVKTMRNDPGAGFDYAGTLAAIFVPASTGDWLQLLALVAIGAIFALFTAAVAAARRGAWAELAANTAPGEAD